MNIFYIKEFTSSNEFLNKPVWSFPNCIKKLWASLKIRCGKFDEKDNIITLPVSEPSLFSLKKSEKLVKKMIKKYECKTVVLSKNLNSNEIFKNILNSHNVNILDGRYLFRFLVFDMIDDVLNKKGKMVQDAEISIMLNEADDINVQSIFLLAKKAKRLNIITNHTEFFKRIEQKLYDDGIIIMVSNNKRKSLLKSDIVVNIDFVEEALIEYKFNNNCTIINVGSNIKVYNKGFNGININDYDIEFIPALESLKNDFEGKLVYESFIYNFSDFDFILCKIKEDNLKIKELIGNKGHIIDL